MPIYCKKVPPVGLPLSARRLALATGCSLPQPPGGVRTETETIALGDAANAAVGRHGATPRWSA